MPVSRHCSCEIDILVCPYTGHPFEGGRFFLCNLWPRPWQAVAQSQSLRNIRRPSLTLYLVDGGGSHRQNSFSSGQKDECFERRIKIPHERESKNNLFLPAD